MGRHYIKSNYVAIMFICFQKCQDIAVGWKFFICFLVLDILLKFKAACWDAKQSKVFEVSFPECTKILQVGFESLNWKCKGLTLMTTTVSIA